MFVPSHPEVQMGLPDGAFAAADVLDAIGQAVIVTDLDGIVVRWNSAAEELYGWTAAEAVGSPISSLCVPDMAQEVAEDIMATLRAGSAWSGSFPVRRKDGTLFTALVTDSAIHHEGELVGIVGVTTNLGAALEPLLDRSTDAALVVRADATIVFASSAVEQLFGWNQKSLIGTSIVPLLHPDDLASLAAVLDKVVATSGPHPPVELRVRCDDEWRWAEATLTNFFDDPVVRGLVCNLRLSPSRDALEAAEVRAQQLQTALESRVLIEQAKGFLAAREGIEPDVAFQRLRVTARSSHRSLHEVAREVLSGDLQATSNPAR
jgi:PAS domain S-box-containing protein